MTATKTLDDEFAPHIRSSTNKTGVTAGSAGVSAPLAIIAIIAVAVSLRPGIVLVGPILPNIIDEFHLSHATASLLTSIPDVLMGLLALPTPWLARRFGRDPVLIAALTLLCISIIARAFAPDTFSILATTAGTGAGIAVAGALIAGFVKARFPAQAAMMMGVYATALSFGSTVSAAITGPVAAMSGGWRLAAGMWGILGIVAVAAWLAVTISERRNLAEVPVVDVAPTRLPLRNRTAWLVALFFACDNLLFYALLSWTAPMYHEAGRTGAIPGLILASFTASFMLANPVFGWLSKSEDRRLWLAVSGLLSVIGLAALAIAPGFAPFLFIPLTAVGLGGGFTLGMTLPLDNTRSVQEANVWNAFVLTVGYLIASTGPLTVGFLRDHQGDFHGAVWVLVGVAAAMLCLTPFLKPQDN